MKTILFILTAVICDVIMAQKQEIIALNSAFTDDYIFSWTRKGIEINFQKNDKTFRIEFFRISEIDWEKIYFNESDGVIVVSCREGYSNCIDRRIIKTKSRRQYSKTRLKTSGPEQTNTALELLKRFSAY